LPSFQGLGSLAGQEWPWLTLSPILLILYVLVYTLIAFGLVMAFDPHWISTLFGWVELLVTFGFLAAFAFSYLIFMRNLIQQPST